MSYEIHEIPVDYLEWKDPIFDSLRAAYPAFGDWTEHVITSRERRLALIASGKKELDAVAILKFGEGPEGDEKGWTKISTFKVADGREGAGIGDGLLSAILRVAVQRGTPRLFITVLPGQSRLLDYLVARGFTRTSKRTQLGEDIWTFDLSVPRRVYAQVNALTYDTLASAYHDRSLSPGPNQETASRLAGALLSHLPHASRARVVELGPGCGDVLAELSGENRVAIGVEISPRMAEVASARAPRAIVCICDGMNLEFAHESIDAVYAGAFIHLVPREAATSLSHRIAKWLRPGGVLFINTSVRSHSRDLEFESKGDYPFEPLRARSTWTEADLRDLITGAGLEVIQRLQTDESERDKFWVAFIARKPDQR